MPTRSYTLLIFNLYGEEIGLSVKQLYITQLNFQRNEAFLADRTIGRAFGTLCRLSVCLSSVCDVLYPGKTAGPICMKFSGKVWTDHGTT